MTTTELVKALDGLPDVDVIVDLPEATVRLNKISVQHRYRPGVDGPVEVIVLGE